MHIIIVYTHYTHAHLQQTRIHSITRMSQTHTRIHYYNAGGAKRTKDLCYCMICTYILGRPLVIFRHSPQENPIFAVPFQRLLLFARMVYRKINAMIKTNIIYFITDIVYQNILEKKINIYDMIYDVSYDILR